MEAVITCVAQDYVATIIDEGDHKGQSATFSRKNWNGNVPPEKDQMVELSGVRMFKKGWRAASASPIMAETAKANR